MILMMSFMTQVMWISIRMMVVKLILMMVFWMPSLMNFRELVKQDLLNLQDLRL